MTKTPFRPPDPLQVFSLLAGGSGFHPSTPRQQRRPTVAGAAAILKTTPRAITRVVKVFQSGGMKAV